MARQLTSWRRFRLRTLVFATLMAAVFFAGYRLGFHEGRDALSDRLLDLINATIQPNTWEDVAGSGTIDSSFEIRCFLVSDDSTDESGDPFDTNDTNDADPFTFDGEDPFAANAPIVSPLDDDPFK